MLLLLLLLPKGCGWRLRPSGRLPEGRGNQEVGSRRQRAGLLLLLHTGSRCNQVAGRLLRYDATQTRLQQCDAARAKLPRRARQLLLEDAPREAGGLLLLTWVEVHARVAILACPALERLAELLCRTGAAHRDQGAHRGRTAHRVSPLSGVLRYNPRRNPGCVYRCV